MTKKRIRDPGLKPDAVNFNPSPEYFEELAKSTGLTQQELAERIGHNERTIRKWCTGERPFSYPVQYIMEALVLHP